MYLVNILFLCMLDEYQLCLRLDVHLSCTALTREFALLQELADKMLEMITIVSEDIQREIITCLPDVVEDSEHSHVATSLRWK